MLRFHYFQVSQRQLRWALLCSLFAVFATLAQADDETWRRAEVGKVGAVSALLLDDKLIYAGTRGGGVFVSSNGASTWSPANTGLDASDVYALARDASGAIYAGTEAGVFKRAAGSSGWQAVTAGLQRGNRLHLVRALQADAVGNVLAGTDVGVFKLGPGATSWVAASNGIASRINALALEGSGALWAAGDGGVWRSTDSGASWAALHGGLAGVYINALAVDAAGNIHAGSAGQGVFKLARGSSNWVAAKGLPARHIASLAAGDSVLYAASADGVYRSTDDGASWSLGANQPEAFALLVAPSGNVYAGTPEGVVKSTSRGASWVATRGGLTSSGFYALAVDSQGTIYAGGDSGLFQRNKGSGAWVVTPSNLTSNTRISALVADKRGTVYVGTSDRGVHSREVGENSGWRSTATGPTRVTALAVDGADNLFAADEYDGVFVGTPGGKRWRAVNQGLPSKAVQALCVDAKGAALAATSAGVYHLPSLDQGWTAANAGLTPALTISALLCAADGSHYAATTRGGLYQRGRDGKTWSQLGNVPTNVDIRSLMQDASGDLYAGTVGYGIFRSRDGGLNWAPVRSGLDQTRVFALAVDRHGSNYAATNHGIYQYTAASAIEKPLSITGDASGGTGALQLTANIQVASGDIGKQGNIYIVAIATNGVMFALTPAGWQPYNPANASAYAKTTLGTHSYKVFDGTFNVTPFKGASILVGYGNDASEVMSKKQYAVIYTVP